LSAALLAADWVEPIAAAAALFGVFDRARPRRMAVFVAQCAHEAR
jgi:predicted chitinase